MTTVRRPHEGGLAHLLDPPEVHQAEGVLCERLGVSIEQAAEDLRVRAAAAGRPVLDVAHEVLAENAADTSRYDPWGSC